MHHNDDADNWLTIVIDLLWLIDRNDNDDDD